MPGLCNPGARTPGFGQAVVAHTFNPSTHEAEAGGSLLDRGRPGLQSEFQDSQSYTEKPCLEKKKKGKKEKNPRIYTC